MPLKILIDENIRRGALWKAIQEYNRHSETPVDAIRVGNGDAPEIETEDPDLLVWAAAHDRILLSQDFGTLAGHLAEFLDTGEESPGIILLQPGLTIQQIIDALVIVCHCGRREDFANVCTWLPT